MGTGADLLIGGFVVKGVEGADTGTVLIRAVGPTLGDFGLTVAEAWPELETWNGGCSPPWDPAELRDKLERAGQWQVASQ